MTDQQTIERGESAIKAVVDLDSRFIRPDELDALHNLLALAKRNQREVDALHKIFDRLADDAENQSGRTSAEFLNVLQRKAAAFDILNNGMVKIGKTTYRTFDSVLLRARRHAKGYGDE